MAPDAGVGFGRRTFRTGLPPDWRAVRPGACVPRNPPLAGLEPGLEETGFRDPTNFARRARAGAGEDDPATGTLAGGSFPAADDFGAIVSPMIAWGERDGGMGRGIRQALPDHAINHAVHRADGQLGEGSVTDHAMRRDDDLPADAVVRSCQASCTRNPPGARDCGDAGAIGSPPAEVHAVMDALHRGGHSRGIHIDRPPSPAPVRAAVDG